MAGRYGVDPVLSTVQEPDPPFCPHGPTLRFKRFYPDKEPREFYACAAHRDRKGCSFFHWADEKISEEKRSRWMKEFEEEQLPLQRGKCPKKEKKNSAECHYCPQCSVLLYNEELSSHSQHGVIQNLTALQLQEPTALLNPVDNKKSQAQFYFSDAALHLVHTELKRLQFRRVLCVGTPRLHEACTKDGGMKSLLLDIDHRFLQFYTPHQFQRYNMFNHYFYDPAGLEICCRFMTEEVSNSLALVIDPPFGGLAEVLAVSLKKLWTLAGDSTLTTLLFFPYFLEAHVTSSLPSLWMMDYQVTYLNHKHYGHSAAKKLRPSPVRIFTNLPLPGLRLADSEGYRLCELCNRYVAELNKHCHKCGRCTSKDGRSYFHCDKCNKCSKQSQKHCSVCDRCELPYHTCGEKERVGCHLCGVVGHKRKDCPSRDAEAMPTQRKRKRPSRR